MPPAYRTWDIRTSFMQRLPLVKRHHQPFMPLFPLAFEQFDLAGYDLVISLKSAFCHGVIPRPQARHICYCLTPTRFLWQFHDYARQENLGRWARWALPFFLSYARLWDWAAAQRVDHFLAISRVVAARIAKYYRRPAAILHPPVDCAAYRPQEGQGDYFLVVARLVPYKRLDIAIGAFNRLRRPLKIVGRGRDAARLAKMAGPSVQFLGQVSDDALKALYAGCQALIFPGEEDFGLAPLEAQASGRPVIAYAGGGALDTVVEGVTGAFFHEPTAEALAEVVSRFDPRAYDPAAVRRHAEGFDVAVFRRRFAEFVAAKCAAPPAVGEGEGQ